MRYEQINQLITNPTNIFVLVKITLLCRFWICFLFLKKKVKKNETQRQTDKNMKAEKDAVNMNWFEWQKAWDDAVQMLCTHNVQHTQKKAFELN